MDSLTHLALGACVGEMLLGRAVGKKALLIGALAQSLPDIDGVAGLWLPMSANLLAHRGITHSLLVAPLAASVLAWLVRRWHWARAVSPAHWFLFFVFQLCLHDLLDTANAYGTGLLEPFSHERFSVYLLYVADPFFTLPLVITALFLWLLFRRPRVRQISAVVALVWAVSYVGYAAVNKSQVDNPVRTSLAAANISYVRYSTIPTPLNTWLWYVVATTDQGYYLGYRSVFEDPAQPIEFTYFPRSEYLLKESLSSVPKASLPRALRVDVADVHRLRQFSRGDYVVEKQGDTLAIDVIRFGQVLGWDNPRAPFVFRYELGEGIDNRLVVQRGRFAGWDQAALRRYILRIRAVEPFD